MTNRGVGGVMDLDEDEDDMFKNLLPSAAKTSDISSSDAQSHNPLPVNLNDLIKDDPPENAP